MIVEYKKTHLIHILSFSLELSEQNNVGLQTRLGRLKKKRSEEKEKKKGGEGGKERGKKGTLDQLPLSRGTRMVAEFNNAANY